MRQIVAMCVVECPGLASNLALCNPRSGQDICPRIPQRRCFACPLTASSAQYNLGQVTHQELLQCWIWRRDAQLAQKEARQFLDCQQIGHRGGPRRLAGISQGRGPGPPAGQRLRQIHILQVLPGVSLGDKERASHAVPPCMRRRIGKRTSHMAPVHLSKYSQLHLWSRSRDISKHSVGLCQRVPKGMGAGLPARRAADLERTLLKAVQSELMGGSGRRA